MSMNTQQDNVQTKHLIKDNKIEDHKKGQYIKLGGQKGYSLLQGLLILAIISIVVTIVLSYFS